MRKRLVDDSNEWQMGQEKWLSGRVEWLSGSVSSYLTIGSGFQVKGFRIDLFFNLSSSVWPVKPSPVWYLHSARMYEIAVDHAGFCWP
jgi:hypothetical protein